MADFLADINAGIEDFGFGQQYLIPISAGIKKSWLAQVDGGVATVSIGPPGNPLVVHIGQGALLFQWDATTQAVKEYQVQASLSLASGYRDFWVFPGGNSSSGGMAYNVPIGITAYFKIRAVHVTGLASSYVQVKRGLLAYPTFDMQVTAINGTVIPANSIFAAVVGSRNGLVAFRTDSEINI